MEQPVAQSRSHETRVKLDAPVGEVWQALTTRDGLRQWFGLEAKDAQAGGRFFVSWGETSFIDAAITSFEENRHLRWEFPLAQAGEPIALVTDFHLETVGGKTLLRIVTSGFGAAAAWDDEFDGMMKGWAIFATNLAHYFGWHRGQLAQSFGFAHSLRLTRADAWERLTGPGGLCTLQAGRGQVLDATTGWGETFSGWIDVRTPPATLGLVLTNWNHALMRFEFTGLHSPPAGFNVMVLTWGVPAERIATLDQRLRAALIQLFKEELSS